MAATSLYASALSVGSPSKLGDSATTGGLGGGPGSYGSYGYGVPSYYAAATAVLAAAAGSVGPTAAGAPAQRQVPKQSQQTPQQQGYGFGQYGGHQR